MPAIELPRRHVGLLQEHAARLLDSRKPKTELESLARDLVTGFIEACTRTGLDRALVELEQAFPALDTNDRATVHDHPTLIPALVAQIGTIGLDGGGPRNAKPLQLANCVVAALGLTVVDDIEEATELDDKIRGELAAALASAVDAELAVPQIRNTIIATARAQCAAIHYAAFDKLTAELDERGMRIMRQPKVPLDATQLVQRHLHDARLALLDRVVRAAFDRAKVVLARQNPELAEKIDVPVTQRLTPRDIAVLRVADSRVLKTPAGVNEALLEALTDLLRITWKLPERPVRSYAANQTFAVGELIEHPKFGRGSVTSCMARRIDVEFPDGKLTLVHVPAAK